MSFIEDFHLRGILRVSLIIVVNLKLVIVSSSVLKTADVEYSVTKGVNMGQAF